MISFFKNRDWDHLRSYWGYLKTYRRSVFLGLGFIPLISFFHLIQPAVLKWGIDGPILQKDLGGLWIFSLLLGGAVFLEFLCRTLQNFIFHSVGIRTVAEIRVDLFRQLLKNSSTYFDKTPVGTLVTRTTSDIEALNESFSSGVVTLFSDVIILLGVLVAMFLLSAKLTLFILVALPLLAVMVNFFRKRLRQQFNKIRTLIGQINATLREQLEGVAVVQIMQREMTNLKAFKKQTRDYRGAVMRSVYYDSLLYSVVESANAVVLGLMIWFGFGLYQNDTITLGLLIAFLDYINRLFNPLKELSGKFATLQAALAALEKIFGSFRIQDEIPSGTRSLPQTRGHLRFENVSFAYPGHENKPVLKGVSFEVKPGEVVALVGPTGSGKTTVSRLVSHLYTGYQGKILLDGLDIQDIKLQDLRRRIAIVLQDVTLFSASVRFNLTLGDPSIEEDRMKEAAKAVQANEFIEKLPGGYEASLAARGQNLSVGQAQLLAFARALSRKTDFFLLDEATASVDSLNEKLIQAAIKKIFQEKTVLVIAHRLSTIQEADKILAMKDGEIAEFGSHRELMAKNGFYTKLFNMQYAHL